MAQSRRGIHVPNVTDRGTCFRWLPVDGLGGYDRLSCHNGQQVRGATDKIDGLRRCVARLNTDTKQLSYTMTYMGLSGPATAAHFHGPADAGQNAGVAVPIGNNPPSPSTGTVTLTDAQMKDLEAGKWYANVHTADNKGGEIRGQLVQVK